MLDYENVDERDVWQERARGELVQFFEKNKTSVFFSRQLEVMLEDRFFHWITNRVLRELVEEGFLKAESRPLAGGSRIHLLWHSSYRYYRRDAQKIVKLVEEYADPNIAGAVGLHGEAMVLEGFAREQFVMAGRNTRAYRGAEWRESDHNLDFIFERDNKVYGVEVKNTLGYMDKDELDAKVELCQTIKVVPVFVVRMVPKSWVIEVKDEGGFVLILKHQLYPWGHKGLATRVKRELGLPVDAPRALETGTMQRFVNWHVEQ